VTKKKQTPSKEVDQKQLINDKAKALRENNYEDDHVRKVTISGADGQ
jgi:hypothetical protein